MARSAQQSLLQAIATATGASPHIELTEGVEYLISFTCAGAFTLTLQVESGGIDKWDDVYDSSGIVTINSASGKQNTVVVAGNYRMNVATYNNPITMYARRV